MGRPLHKWNSVFLEKFKESNDANEIIGTLNFLKSIRGDLGLPKDFTPEFLQESAKLAADAFPP